MANDKANNQIKNLYLPSHIKERIEQESKNSGLPQSTIASVIVTKYYEEQEKERQRMSRFLDKIETFISIHASDRRL